MATPSGKKEAAVTPKKQTWGSIVAGWIFPKYAMDRQRFRDEMYEIGAPAREIRKRDDAASKLMIATSRYTKLSSEILAGDKDIDSPSVKAELALLEAEIETLHRKLK